ncbi:MAG: HD domain-containing phosphohydrolase [Pseudomonadota bacterium]
MEYRVVLPDGTTRFLWANGYPIRDDSGQVCRIAGVAADITKRKEAEEETLRHGKVLAGINRIFRDSLLHEDIDAVAKTCLMVAQELTDSHFGFIGELNRKDLFDVIAISDPGWEACKMPDSAATALTKNMEIRGIDRSVLRDGESRIVNDPASHPDWCGLPEGHPPITSFLGIPMKQGDRICGMIGLANKASGYTLKDQEAIETLSVAFLEALNSKRASSRIQSQVEQLAALRAIDMAITGSLDIRVTFSIFLDQALQQLKVDAADVLVLSPLTNKLEFVAERGFKTSALKHTKLSVGKGLAGRAAKERSVVRIDDLTKDKDALAKSPLFDQEEFIAYFGAPLIAKGKVMGVLELFHRSPLDPDPDWLHFMESLTAQAAIAVDSATLFTDLQKSNTNLLQAYDATIEGWSRALDLRDKETEGHSRRVTDMTVEIAKSLGIDDSNLLHVRRGALLHDIGKMGIPDAILLKPGPLSDEEWEIMRNHPRYAYDLLYPIEFLRPSLDIPYCHHEKWDGTGYPRGLKGEQIPLAGRIFALVDVWDALRSDRPYRPAWPEEKVIEHIKEMTGKQFDPKVVEVFLGLLDASTPV